MKKLRPREGDASHTLKTRATKQCSPMLNPFPSPQGTAFHSLNALWCGWEVYAESRGLFLYANEPHFPPSGWRRRFILVTTESTFPSLLCFWLEPRITHSDDIFCPWRRCLHCTLSCSFPSLLLSMGISQWSRCLEHWGLLKLTQTFWTLKYLGWF